MLTCILPLADLPSCLSARRSAMETDAAPPRLHIAADVGSPARQRDRNRRSLFAAERAAEAATAVRCARGVWKALESADQTSRSSARFGAKTSSRTCAAGIRTQLRLR